VTNAIKSGARPAPESGQRLPQGWVAGGRSLVIWADVLDRINVFPVPDGDTGRNLAVTLAPLQRDIADSEELKTRILQSARGNSGNIAAGFFCGFLEAEDPRDLPEACRKGRDLAYAAIKHPVQGTMLSLFDELVGAMIHTPPGKSADWASQVTKALEYATLATRSQLPELEAAGVVDAGALGMFLFFRTCFFAVTGRDNDPQALPSALKPFLHPSDTWQADMREGYCLDAVIRPGKQSGKAMDALADLGESAIATSRGEVLKIHLHTGDRQRAREELEKIGEIVGGASDDLAVQTRQFTRPAVRQALHVVTDAAGSIARHQALDLGLTLLDSYILIGDDSLPETYVDPEHLFPAMRKGIKVSTSQASTWEREQAYEKILDLHSRALYVTVGSFYTGNHEAAVEWKAAHDPEDRFLLLDSGTASGHLGLSAMAAARFSMVASAAEEVVDFARRALDACGEILFLDRLQFLAAGGRMSKTSAFFGDLLHMKPAITPGPSGVEKVAVPRNRKDQVDLALKDLERALDPGKKAVVMAEHTDNLDWIESEMIPRIQQLYPQAYVFAQPLSLTSASHMGPGTWGVAFLQLPELDRMEPFFP
jgi:uncharacterized protein